MLKFIKYHLASIEGMDTLASIALILFVGIFIYVSYYAFFVMSSDTAEEMADLPFQEGQE